MPKTTTPKKATPAPRELTSTIHIENCQIKSLEKAQALCKALDTLEKEIGIRSVRIRFKNNFVCPDIDLLQLSQSSDSMEKLIGNLLIRIDIGRNGKKSKYKKQPETKPGRAYPVWKKPLPEKIK